MFKDKTILYVVHNYNNFQKDPIEESAKYFKKVYVLVRYKPISKIVKYWPIKWLKKYDDSKVIALRDVPNNVEVIRTPVWYWPYGFMHKILGGSHFRAVDKAIKEYNIKFDLVHCHFLWSSGYVGMRVKEKYNIPFVVTGHGFDVYELPFTNNWWRNNIKNILKHTNHIITVGRKNKGYLLKLGIKGSKISVIGNGYNSKLFFPLDRDTVRKDLGIDKNRRILLSVGNLERVKGHKYLIMAINILKEKYPNILCYIIGEGSLRGELEKLINDYSLGDNVFLLGYLKHEELNKWINVCDIFVLPSLAESFGIVQLEAFACGKPVVATRNAGSLDMIKSSKYGLLCNIRDSGDLADKIGKAFDTKWVQREILKHVEAFGLDKRIQDICRIYEQIIYNM